MDCIFCKIINRESPGSFIYEDEYVTAIIPKDQVTDGHILIIPNTHYRDIFDIDDEILSKVILITKKLSKDLINEPSTTSVNILNASGADAQQSVFHFHFHIVPRRHNDGLDMWIKQNL
jgi:histidine triad (HIT) family protein